MNFRPVAVALLSTPLLPLFLLVNSAALALTRDGLASLCADRAAIERVYYEHRLGAKPAFEQLLPPSAVEQLVKQDLRKEALLSQAYGVNITTTQIAAEVARMNSTTRAPDILGELKQALGNDPARFAQSVAKPIIVERELREHFENDDRLHAPQRREVEMVRVSVLTAKASGAAFDKLLPLLGQNHSGQVSETTWQLASRPAETYPAEPPDVVKIHKRFGPNAQLISAPPAEPNQKVYFGDLQPELQNVLRAQLRQTGDVSAVIEMPGTFLLYLAKEKTDEALRVAKLSIPKRSFEEWLAEETRTAK